MSQADNDLIRQQLAQADAEDEIDYGEDYDDEEEEEEDGE